MPTPVDPAPDTTAQPATAPDKAPPAVLPASPDSRLASLVADYCALKPEFDKLAAQLKEITDAIKSESRTACPRVWGIDIYLPGAPRPLKVRGRKHRTFDVKAYRADHPVDYVTYCTWPERWEVGF